MQLRVVEQQPRRVLIVGGPACRQRLRQVHAAKRHEHVQHLAAAKLAARCLVQHCPVNLLAVSDAARGQKLHQDTFGRIQRQLGRLGRPHLVELAQGHVLRQPRHPRALGGTLPHFSISSLFGDESAELDGGELTQHEAVLVVAVLLLL